jgi:hypothetical protein
MRYRRFPNQAKVADSRFCIGARGVLCRVRTCPCPCPCPCCVTCVHYSTLYHKAQKVKMRDARTCGVAARTPDRRAVAHPWRTCLTWVGCTGSSFVRNISTRDPYDVRVRNDGRVDKLCSSPYFCFALLLVAFATCQADGILAHGSISSHGARPAQRHISRRITCRKPWGPSSQGFLLQTYFHKQP